MTSQLAVAEPQQTAIVQQQAITPMGLLQVALDKDSNIDVIERLAKLQREEREYQALCDFNDALNRVQGKLRRIAADMENPQTRSRYASYAALDRAVRPDYVAEGFSVSFSEAEGSTAEYMTMLAYLSRGGHTRVYRKGMAIDTKGPKGNDVMTKTHASGSAGSYAKRYLLKDIFNLSIGEDDDDGNGGGGMGDQEFITWREAINAAPTMDALQDVYKKAYSAAKAVRDEQAMGDIIRLKDHRKTEIGGAR